jgi:hypothetical protein
MDLPGASVVEPSTCRQLFMPVGDIRNATTFACVRLLNTKTRSSDWASAGVPHTSDKATATVGKLRTNAFSRDMDIARQEELAA